MDVGFACSPGKQDSGGDDDAGGAKHSCAVIGAIPALRTERQKKASQCAHRSPRRSPRLISCCVQASQKKPVTAMTDEAMPTGVRVDTPARKSPWAVYLLDCAGGKSYIGISPRPQERFEAHLAGKGGAFTRANRPQGLAGLVWFESRSAAASIEPRLKCLRRQSKLAWFKHLAGTTAPAPATLDEGLASLSRV